jgi:hypothetical protein
MLRMETTPSGSNVIDLCIKYGAVIGFVAYGLGLLEQYDFFERMGIRGDLSVADPMYFVLGAYLLGQIIIPVAGVGFEVWAKALAKALLHAERLDLDLKWHLAVINTLFGFVLTFTIALVVGHAWVRDAVWVSAAGGSACGVVIFEIGRMRKRGRLDLWEPVYPLLIITFCLTFFALGNAKVRWRRVLAEHGRDQVRLLIAGDAVRGAREMGLTFPESPPGDKSAELSNPVEVVFEGERTYVLRVNGQIAQLGKVEVLGSVP